MVKIKKQFVETRSLSYPGTNGRKFITIHETANTDKGADAQSHANLQSNGNNRQASWHWTVDDTQAIQSFPHTVRCWHAGDGEGDGNFNSIAIEICVNSDGDFKKAVQNAIELVEKIMADEGISTGNVVQHNHWSGKDCPHYLRDGERGITWDDFKNKLAGKKPTTVNMSVVDYLQAIGQDSSFSARKKLAAEYGIKNYTGTAKQNTELLSKLKSNAASKPKHATNPSSSYKGNSIVDYLKSIHKDSSFSNRKELAKQYGINNYTGTAAQNEQLLHRMRTGHKKSGDMKTTSVVDYLKSIGENSSFAHRAKLAARYGIKNYKGTAAQNNKLLNKLRG